MRNFLQRIGLKKRVTSLDGKGSFQGIDPKHVTRAAVQQVSELVQKISGNDVTMELAITHVLHEKAKAKYFTTEFPAANGHE